MSPGRRVRRPPSATPSEFWVAVIDDDASIRAALSRVFRGSGIRVEAFGSAEEYLRQARVTQPSCLVLDVQLNGGMDGFEFHDRLVAEGSAPPTIFITGFDDATTASRARASGAIGYLRKPFGTDVLLALVRPHLQ